MPFLLRPDNKKRARKGSGRKSFKAEGAASAEVGMAVVGETDPDHVRRLPRRVSRHTIWPGLKFPLLKSTDDKSSHLNCLPVGLNDRQQMLYYGGWVTYTVHPLVHLLCAKRLVSERVQRPEAPAPTVPTPPRSHPSSWSHFSFGVLHPATSAAPARSRHRWPLCPEPAPSPHRSRAGARPGASPAWERARELCPVRTRRRLWQECLWECLSAPKLPAKTLTTRQSQEPTARPTPKPSGGFPAPRPREPDLGRKPGLRRKGRGRKHLPAAAPRPRRLSRAGGGPRGRS